MTHTYFIDDSGQGDPPVFVLGGIGFDSNRVKDFEADWHSVLATEPPITQFKMKEANRCKGDFQGFSLQARDAKLKALAEVICRHSGNALSVCVRHDAFERHFRGRMMDAFDHPYELLHHLVIANAFNLHGSLSGTVRANFVFDRQQGAERSVLGAFAALEEGLDPRIRDFLDGQPRFADDRDELGLQAADMMAWHIRRSWDGAGSIAAASAAGPALETLVSRHVYLDEVELTLLSEAATSTIRNLETVFPHEAEQINSAFPQLASWVNLQVMASARPFESTELISFPASGMARFLLVRRCSQLNSPHLHKRDGNVCRGAETAV